MRKISRTESSVAEGCWAEEEECSAEEEEEGSEEEVFAEEVEFSVAVVTVEVLSWWWWWFFSGELLLLEFAEVEAAAAFTPKRLRTMRIISSRICSAISLLLLAPCLLFVLKGLVWLEEFPPNKEDEEEEEVPW